jgi:hypothetical protein
MAAEPDKGLAPVAAKPVQEVSTPCLTPIPFESGVVLDEHNFHLVTGFTCARRGQAETRWERDVSWWLLDTGRGGAREAIRLGKSEVRLFFSDDQRLIGYGAIGLEDWPVEGGGALTLGVLQYAGVHTDFRSPPGHPLPPRYGLRIIEGMIQEIKARWHPALLGLYVDPENPAKKDYLAANFKPIDTGEVWTDPDDGRQWCRMMRSAD